MAGRWGWRPLIMSLFFSVFVVACNLIQNIPTAGTATNPANVTLTLRHPRGPTPTPSARPAASLITPAEANAAVTLGRLECYETSGGQSLCLGSVRNSLGEPLGPVAVTLQLEDAAGMVVAQQTTVTEQSYLPPNGVAPYRVVWAEPLQSEQRVRPVSARAEPADTARFVPLHVRSIRGRSDDERYIVTARVTNPESETVVDLRAVLTVWTEDGRLSGYRVTQVGERLEAGKSLEIEIDLIPQLMGGRVLPSLHVEAVRGSVVR